MLRLSPPAGTRLETEGSLDAQVGGAESNVAAAASCLGADATWLSKLPANPLGRRVVRALRSHNVTPAVTWDDRETARLGTYYLEYGADPRNTEVIYDRAGSAVTTVSPAELDVDILEQATVFHTTGITPALSEAAAETTMELISAVREAGVVRSFDLNYRAKLWTPAEAKSAYESILPEIDLLFAPVRDARGVLDCKGDAEAVARSFAADYNIETVVVTRGAEGSLALVGNDVIEQGVFDSEAVDAIGTGDAFVGGVLGELLADSEIALTADRIETALSYGAAAAALKRSLAGDVLVTTREELERVRDTSAGGISR